MADHAYTPNEGTWGAGYAMVPGWLVQRGLTPDETHVYVHLALHGTFNPATGTYESIWPSLARLSRGAPDEGYPGTGLSKKRLREAIAGLVAKGGLVVTSRYARDGSQLSNGYRVVFGVLVPPAQGGGSDAIPPPGYQNETPPGVDSDTPPPVSKPTHDPEPPTQNHLPTSPPTPRTKPAGAAVAEAEAGRQEEGDQDQQAVLPAVAAAAGQDQAAAAALIDGLPWPAGQAPDPDTRDRLRAAAAACLTAGHPQATVTSTAADGIPGARRPAAVVLHRLRRLAAQPPDQAAAAREQAEQARREAARTPHPHEGPRAGYCARCGHHETHRVHRRATPATAGSTTTVERCAEHGRRVCVTCHGGRRNDTTGSGDRQRPAPRQRPAAEPDPAPASGPTPAGQEFHRALAAMAGRMVAA